MFPRLFLSILLFLGLLSACSPYQLPAAMTDTGRPWQYADLRRMDALDAAKPEQDIVAAYARLSGADVEARLDLLQSKSNLDFDLYLAVDAQPGGKADLPIQGAGDVEWEVWISFPAGAPSTATRSNGEKLPGLTPRLYRDLNLDAAIVRLNWKDLGISPHRLRFQVFLTEPGAKQVIDQTSVFSLDGTSPRRAPLLLAFWNTLPAQTPAQALRRWNGAHTGPAGHRHGLAQILQAIEANRVPAVLLDLKTPDSLAGLEQVGGLEQARRLAALNLLLLPDAGFGDPSAVDGSLTLSREAGLRFGLTASPAAFAALSTPSTAYRIVFVRKAEIAHPVVVAGTRVIPLPAEEAQQPDLNGFTLAMRNALINAALQDPPPMSVFGGDVQQTLWADADVAGKAFAYIAGHPWILPLNSDDLLTLPGENLVTFPLAEGCQNILCSPLAGTEQAEQLRSTLRHSIQAIEDDQWREITWMMVLRLTQPTADPQRAALQAGYLGQIGYFLQAAGWLRRPGELATCAEDLDWDGQPECILASGQVFTIIDPRGARLALAITIEDGQPREWVAPSSQFAVGLGPPDDWQPELGEAGDPRVIPGGLADEPNAFIQYQAVAERRQIRLTGPEGRQTVYALDGDRIQIEVQGNPPGITRIPLVLGAGTTRGIDWGIRFSRDMSGDGRSFAWWGRDQDGVRVETSARLEVNSSLDSFAFMREPEDPDREYPPGHFLPYPIIEIVIQADGPFNVSIGPK